MRPMRSALHAQSSPIFPGSATCLWSRHASRAMSDSPHLGEPFYVRWVSRLWSSSSVVYRAQATAPGGGADALAGAAAADGDALLDARLLPPDPAKSHVVFLVSSRRSSSRELLSGTLRRACMRRAGVGRCRGAPPSGPHQPARPPAGARPVWQRRKLARDRHMPARPAGRAQHAAARLAGE